MHRAVRLLAQADARRLDEELMGPAFGFRLEQLMELAGLSVASAIAEVFDRTKHRRVCVVCGPGNNGGDGLVAARHLRLFGFDPAVVLPKPGRNPYFRDLEKQCERQGVSVLPDLPRPLSDHADLVVDAIFGFGFSGDVRAPFGDVLDHVCASGLPVASVDVPSGWVVDGGGDRRLQPALLISLTAPKLCAKDFAGHHYLGGRFVPPAIAEKYNLDLPPYDGARQCVRLE